MAKVRVTTGRALIVAQQNILAAAADCADRILPDTKNPHLARLKFCVTRYREILAAQADLADLSHDIMADFKKAGE